MQPSDAKSHPFLNVNLPIIPLCPSLSNASDSVLSKHALFESTLGRSKKSTSPLPYSHRKHPRHSYAPNKTTIDDIRNTHQRTSLYRELSARRIVSDPLPRKQRHFTPEIVLPSSASPVSQHKTSQRTAHPQNRKLDNLAKEYRVPIDDLSPAPVSALVAVIAVVINFSSRPSPWERHGLCHSRRHC
jgi:hypothetical protein